MPAKNLINKVAQSMYSIVMFSFCFVKSVLYDYFGAVVLTGFVKPTVGRLISSTYAVIGGSPLANMLENWF